MSSISSDLPALLGGAPIRPGGPPGWPVDDPDVRAAIETAMRDGSWGRYDGGHVQKLEIALACAHQVSHALTCASGTLAVELALRAAGVEPGDEVILAAYDYEPNFLCVHAVGALPVLVDVSPENWNLNPDLVAEAISNRTRAILVSHLHGGCVPMREVMDVARARNIRVVEDAAQAAGATIQGKPAGSWGDVGIISFGGSKLLTSGRGGALLTSHADLHQRLRLLQRRGVQQWAALSDLQAVALLPQLARLPKRHAERAGRVAELRSALAGVPGLTLFKNAIECSPAYYKVGFQFDAAKFGLDRERFCCALRAEGIAFDPGFKAAHIGRSAGRFRAGGALDESTRAHDGVVILHHPVLLEGPNAVEAVARAVRRVYANAVHLT